MPKNRAVKLLYTRSCQEKCGVGRHPGPLRVVNEIKIRIFSKGSKIPRKFRINSGNKFHVLPKPVKFRIKSFYKYELFTAFSAHFILLLIL